MWVGDGVVVGAEVCWCVKGREGGDAKHAESDGQANSRTLLA